MISVNHKWGAYPPASGNPRDNKPNFEGSGELLEIK